MPAFEKKILIWLEKHLDVILLIAVSVLGMLLRFMLSSLHADMGVPVAGRRIAMLFDLLLAIAVLLLTVAVTDTRRARWAYALMLLSFGNIFASAGMGRWDGLWVALCVAALFMTIKEKYLWAYVSLSAACLISFWALLMLPFFLFVYLYKERPSLIAFIMPVAAALIRFLSGIDRQGWLPEGWTSKKMYVAYPSFWGFIKGDSAAEFDHYMPIAAGMSLVVIAAFIMLTCRRKYKYDKKGLVWLAFLSCFTAAMFIPGAGAPASALSTVLAWIPVFGDPVLVIPALVMEVLRIWPQAAYVYGNEWMPFTIQGLCWIQTALLLFYYIYFYKKVLDLKE